MHHRILAHLCCNSIRDVEAHQYQRQKTHDGRTKVTEGFTPAIDQLCRLESGHVWRDSGEYPLNQKELKQQSAAFQIGLKNHVEASRGCD